MATDLRALVSLVLAGLIDNRTILNRIITLIEDKNNLKKVKKSKKLDECRWKLKNQNY